jgi:hypothetical protein
MRPRLKSVHLLRHRANMLMSDISSPIFRRNPSQDVRFSFVSAANVSSLPKSSSLNREALATD